MKGGVLLWQSFGMRRLIYECTEDIYLCAGNNDVGIDLLILLALG